MNESPDKQRVLLIDDRDRLALAVLLGVLFLVVGSAAMFTLVGSAAGLTFAGVAGVLGAGLTLRVDARTAVAANSAASESDLRRVLVLAQGRDDEGRISGELQRSRWPGPPVVHLVVPSRADADSDIRDLAGGLAPLVTRLEAEVGSPDTRRAIEDALAAFPADEILIAGTPSPGSPPRRSDLATALADRPPLVRDLG